MKKRHLILLLLVTAFLTLGVFSTSAFAAASDCANCHGTKVSDFDIPLLSRTAECIVCHDGGGHASWYDAQGYRRIPQYISGVGYFSSASAVQSPPATLHQAHAGLNSLAGKTGCQQCHQTAACTACHTNVSHQQHGSSIYNNPPSFIQANGTTFSSIPMTCALAPQCHGRMPSVVRTRIDGTPLCLNCHVVPVPKSQGTARDYSGHDSVGLTNSHGTTLPNQLVLGGIPKAVDCSGCHVNPLTTEHANRGRDCSVCHNSGNASVINVVYSAGGQQANRSCDKCHFNLNVIPAPQEHNLFHVAVKSNSIKIDGGPHTDCNVCHTRSTPVQVTVTVSGSVYQMGIPDLAKVSPQSYSCFDCHNGNTNPKAPLHKADYNGQVMGILDVHTSCASCHTPGNTYASKVDTIASSLKANPAAGYSCTDCHTNLSNSHNAYFTYGAETVNMNTTKYHRSCTVCHGNSKVSGIITLLKGSTAAYNCNQCHNSVAAKLALHTTTDNQEIVGYHPNDTVSTRCDKCHGEANFTKINIPTWPASYQCGNCHNGGVAKTAFHQAKDANGTLYTTTDLHPTCAACHDSQDSTVRSVISVNKGTIAPYLCADCHTGTLVPKHNANWSNGVAYETTQFHKNCAQCHGNTSAISNKILAISTDLKTGIVTSYSCTDCHGTVASAAKHSAKLAVADTVYQESTQYHAKLAANTVDSCFTCHNNPVVVTGLNAIFTQVKNGGDYLCTDCHNNQTSAPYKPNHSAVLGSETLNTINQHPACTTCHTTTADTNITDLKGQTGYSCEACHTNLTAKHQSTTNLADIAFVNCSWCHSSTEPAYAASNLIGVHVKPNITLSQTFTCNTCHGAASSVKTQIAGKLTGCADCHNGISAPLKHPDSQYYPRHVANTFPVFMPEYSPNCSTCHTDKSLINLHSAKYVGCNTCHTTDAYKAAVVSLNVDCTGCHSTSVNPAIDMTESHKPFHNANTALYPASANCLNCHAKDATTEGQSLLGVHKKDSASTVTCDTCHASTARQTVKDAVSTNNVSCQACHDSAGHNHPVAVNGYAAQPQVDCSQCHSTNTGDKGAELATVHQKAADAGKIAGYGCNTCHNQTFEGADKVIVKDGNLDMKQNNTTIIYCDTCHNGTLADALENKYPAHGGNHINSGGYGIYKGTYNGQAFDDSAVDCSKCHASLDTKVVHDKTVYPNVDCNTCHQSSNSAVQSVITANWSRSATKVPYTCSSCHTTLPVKHQPEHVGTSADKAALDCSGCHNSSSWTGNNAQVVSLHNSNCNTCHTNPNSVVSDFITGKKGLSNQVYACEGCHTNGGAQTKEAVHKPEHLAQHRATNMDCSSCHTFSIAAGTPTDISSATVHKSGCNTCHSGETTTTAQQNAKLFIAGAKGTANPVYNCEDCHVTIHVGWDNKHEPTFPSDPTMNCASCHNNYLPAEHTKFFGSSASSVGYKVFRSAVSTGPWTEIGSTTAAGFADSGLAANTTYYYKIQAYDGKPNYSGFTNPVSAKTMASTPAATTVNPDIARYASGNNGDSSSDPSSTTDVLARLTDNSTSTYSDVRENGSSDQYIFVKLNRDAKNYTKVELKLNVRYNDGANLTIRPYSTDTSINTNSSYTVDGPYRSSSSNYTTETIDVTNAAHAMDNFGWMKFRIKPDSNKTGTSIYVANVQVVLSQNPVSGGTATNPPGTLASSPNDTVAPTAPTGLAGTSNYYDRIDLTWIASTDQGPSVSESSTCVLCHGSTARADAKAAVTNKNANCSACHTIHANITTAHTGNALPTTPWVCGTCHSNVLSVEHSSNAVLKQNASLNCDTCHKSTLAKVQAAIKSTVTDKSNLKCEACHSGTADGVPPVHSDIAVPHLNGIFPTATDSDCLNCHTTQASEFVSSKGAYHVANGLTSKAAVGWGQYLTPWTSTSIVGCQGCHGNNNDGKAQVS
ncbi:MAG: cytochrome c3 family protein, partial [Eubacteriales bacterium]